MCVRDELVEEDRRVHSGEVVVNEQLVAAIEQSGHLGTESTRLRCLDVGVDDQVGQPPRPAYLFSRVTDSLDWYSSISCAMSCRKLPG